MIDKNVTYLRRPSRRVIFSFAVTEVLASLVIGGAASGQSITFGETVFPLGMNAFSDPVQCLNPAGQCDFFAWGQLFGEYPHPPMPWNGSLSGEHLGDVFITAGVPNIMGAHIATVYDGEALSFEELQVGMKATGVRDYYTASAMSVSTEWP